MGTGRYSIDGRIPILAIIDTDLVRMQPVPQDSEGAAISPPASGMHHQGMEPTVFGIEQGDFLFVSVKSRQAILLLLPDERIRSLCRHV